jgi:DNA-binding transcriptional MerR regulator
MIDKAPDAFRTISEAAEDLDLPQHVLRFWETRFSQIKPLKRGGGRRYYRPDDIEFLRGLKQLLHAERYTIKGVQKIIKEQGVKSVQKLGRGDGAVEPTHIAAALPQVYERPRAPVSTPGRAAVPIGMRGKLEAALTELVDCQRLLKTLHQT